MTREESMAFYRKHSKKLYNISFRIVEDSAEAEDIMQDTVLKYIASGLSLGDKEASVWLEKTCIRASLDSLRRKKREMKYLQEAVEQEPCEDLPSEESPISERRAEILLEAIRELPRGSRLIADLILIEGLEYDEVSEYLGVKEGTLRVRFARAKKLLSEKVKAIEMRKL